MGGVTNVDEAARQLGAARERLRHAEAEHERACEEELRLCNVVSDEAQQVEDAERDLERAYARLQVTLFNGGDHAG